MQFLDRKICGYLSKAERSIDVCMYTLGNHQLVSALMLALDRSVNVRLIIDHTTAAGPDIAKQLNRLGPKGDI
jgi:phosphatidylserine/phosphatidylglycerophosphate/cardiolipin synthase-like enzyme